MITSPSPDQGPLPQNNRKQTPHIDLQRQFESIRQENSELKEMVGRLQEELRWLREDHDHFQRSFEAIVNRLVLASEYQDKNVERHIKRIGRYSAIIAKDLNLSDLDSQTLALAAPMHDIGKVGVPRNILMKPGKLTEEEFGVMQHHTVIGGNMLSNSDSKLLATARKIALTHHEHWDGSGYPTHSRGEQIPLCGRIVGLVDAFDALTSTRPHKMAYPVEMAFDLIAKNKAKRFDPLLVESMQNNLDAFIRAKAEIDTPESLPGSEFELSERDLPSAHVFHAYRFS